MKTALKHATCGFGRTLVTALVAGALTAATAQAAPIGIPAATTGAGKTVIGGEVNILLDRDLSAGGGEAESLQAFAKGSIGVDDRLDLEFRFGLGDVAIDPGTDSDIGPAFGAGFKVTWATLPDANLKIGSVFQTTHVRADDGPSRVSLTEYDAAIGAAIDMGGSKRQRGQYTLIPYFGLAWSGMDINGVTAEDDGFGLFLGAAANAPGAVSFGGELRIVDQIAISLNVGVPF